MIEFLRNWIINIVVLIIFIVIVETIIPSNKFKKFIKLATGLVLMIAIINPIVNLINKDYSLDTSVIASFNDFDKNEMVSQSKSLDDVQNSQVMDIYTGKLESQIKEKILENSGIKDTDVNINIERNSKNKNYGSILGLDIVIYEGKKKSSNIGVNEVKVAIEDKDGGNKLSDQIRGQLSTIYGIPKEKIIINIQK